MRSGAVFGVDSRVPLVASNQSLPPLPLNFKAGLPAILSPISVGRVFGSPWFATWLPRPDWSFQSNTSVSSPVVTPRSAASHSFRPSIEVGRTSFVAYADTD